MPADSIIDISITGAAAGLTEASFDKALLLTCEAAWTERTRTYTSLDGVEDDFADTTGPTYLYAASYFGQEVSPEELVIGRRALKPTLKYKIEIATVADDTDYVIYAGADVVTVDSGTGATNDGLVDDIVDALNDLDSFDTDWTASAEGIVSGSKYVEIVATTAGDYLPVSVDDLNLLHISMTHADAGVATDLAAIQLETSDWYTLLDPFNSHAEIEAAAVWIEANKKQYHAQSIDSECATHVLTDASDIMAHLKTASRDRTCVMFRAQPPSEATDAGWDGKLLPKDPGSETWAFKTISGSTADNLTATWQTNIEAKNGNYYSTWHGRACTLGKYGGGIMASGKFADAIRFKDWLEATMNSDIAALFLDSDKVPGDQDGVDLIEAKIRRRLDLGIQAGGIAKYPEYTVTMTPWADLSDADKAARHVRGSFQATGCGAIQGATINGVIAL